MESLIFQFLLLYSGHPSLNSFYPTSFITFPFILSGWANYMPSSFQLRASLSRQRKTSSPWCPLWASYKGPSTFLLLQDLLSGTCEGCDNSKCRRVSHSVQREKETYHSWSNTLGYLVNNGMYQKINWLYYNTLFPFLSVIL